MEENPDPPERRSLLPFAVVALLIVLYLASVGPMFGLNSRGVISDRHWETICMTVYLPLVYLEMETEFFDTPVGEAYVEYIVLFEP